MNKIKVGTTVRITNTDALYSSYEDWLTSEETKVWCKGVRSVNTLGLYTVTSIRKHINQRGKMLAFCVSQTTGKGCIMGLNEHGSVVFHCDPTVTKVKAKAKPKKRRLYTHYSIQAKRNITREYLELPRGKNGRVARNTIIPLFAKYGIAVSSTVAATQLLKSPSGWIYQYNSGGWDTSNAVAFKRTREIRGVL